MDGIFEEAALRQQGLVARRNVRRVMEQISTPEQVERNKQLIAKWTSDHDVRAKLNGYTFNLPQDELE